MVNQLFQLGKVIVLPVILSFMVSGCDGPKSMFMRACKADGVSKAVCKCGYKKLQDKYGDKLLKDLYENNIDDEKLIREIGQFSFEAGHQCARGK